MQIKFQAIKIGGFRSIVDPQEFKLDRPGLNLIKGTNGKGKSTLFEALVWCLYGDNLKGTKAADVQSWKEVRGKQYNGAKAMVYFQVDGIPYTIERNEPGELIVIADAERIPALDKKDTQAYIDLLLGMDFKTFMNSFMFGQRMTRMVESKSADKRKLFEELFDMDWIQKMRDKAVLDRTEKEHTLGVRQAELSAQNMSVGFHEDAIEEAKKRVENQELKEHLAKVHNEEALKEYQETRVIHEKAKAMREKKLAELPNPVEVKDYTDDITRLEGTLASIEQEISEKERELSAEQAKHESYEQQLANFDSSNYDAYLENLAKIEAEMKDISAILYPGDVGSLLTDQEQMEIQHSYEETLSAYTQAQSTLNTLQRQAVDSGQSECPACKRPFDNADEIDKHKKHIEDEIVKVKGILAEWKITLDAERTDANYLANYIKLEGVLKAMNDNAPRDPEAAKGQLRAQIGLVKGIIDNLKDTLRAQNITADEIDNDLITFQNLQLDSKAQLEKNQSIASETQELAHRIRNSQEDIDKCDDSITRIEYLLKQTELPKLQDELNEKQNKLKSAQQHGLNIAQEVKSIEAELEVINFWVKDVFAANGLKAYIFKAMLDQLNNYTAKYGAKLGCSIRFSLDLTKVSAPFSTICTLGDKANKEYKEFSGGEKQRLDIVLMFAMHDLLSSEADLNIMIMDEVFEGLDEQGESDVFELIREKAENRSVYVISHSQVLDTLHSKTIEIDNINGKTILP